jgi:biotin transport system permease protein
MVELTAFRFHPGASLLHATDVRFKLTFLIIVSFSTLNTRPLGLAMLCAVMAATAFWMRLPGLTVLRDVRFFLIFLAAIWLLRAFSGPKTDPIEIFAITLSSSGVYEGGLICLRLLVLMFAGWLFIATTATLQIKGAIHWFLQPLPFLPAARIAIMVGLMARFLPLVFEKSRQIKTAQKARGIQRRKNPFYRLKSFTIPFVRTIFEDADRLALAMEARSFGENRTDPPLKTTSRDWILLVVATPFFLTLILI